MGSNDQGYRYPGIAAVLSFLCNGLGQLYNGQILKGLLLFSFSVVSLLIFIFGAALIGLWLTGSVRSHGQLVSGCVIACTGLFFIALNGIYSITDAYKGVSKK